ncbi:MAG: hypothetical protein KKG09_07065 [Verrucomicrobia bacterium]|nr:hypothetical protein [Verrucomicrobiota bacterium]MCG2679229.1 hypothetical protein [Kiritimatiellia bacterium]MBU4248623.1 hypothetical protein [Verrucomicrobiota bacterium]MBU4290084.1 hypothetical protein [Verrucomicrobiota bacterium]MBU4428344.1 hypothetical protein [Verrucomicrobiota bacterium]
MTCKITLDSIRFTTKGQMLIPMRRRRIFRIENGTRAIVTATERPLHMTEVNHAKVQYMLKRKDG